MSDAASSSSSASDVDLRDGSSEDGDDASSARSEINTPAAADLPRLPRALNPLVRGQLGAGQLDLGSRFQWRFRAQQRRDLRIALDEVNRPTRWIRPGGIVNEYEEPIDHERLPNVRTLEHDVLRKATPLLDDDTFPSTLLLASILEHDDRLEHLPRGRAKEGVRYPSFEGNAIDVFDEDDGEGPIVAFRGVGQHGRATGLYVWRVAKGQQARLVRDLPTPALQVKLGADASSSKLTLVARTLAFTYVFSLDATTLEPLDAGAQLRGAQLAGEQIADIDLAPPLGQLFGAQGVAVDVRGALFAWSASSGRTSALKLRDGQSAYSGTVRVRAADPSVPSVAVTWESEVKLYDVRSPTSEAALFTLNEGTEERITSYLAPESAQSALHYVCTTEHVLAIDARMPREPAMLSFAHGRAGPRKRTPDVSLELLRVPVPSDRGPSRDVLALASRLQPSLELYTFARSDASLLLDPYFVGAPEREAFSRAGTAFSKGGVMFDLATDGALAARGLSYGQGSTPWAWLSEADLLARQERYDKWQSEGPSKDPLSHETVNLSTLVDVLPSCGATCSSEGPAVYTDEDLKRRLSTCLERLRFGEVDAPMTALEITKLVASAHSDESLEQSRLDKLLGKLPARRAVPLATLQFVAERVAQVSSDDIATASLSTPLRDFVFRKAPTHGSHGTEEASASPSSIADASQTDANTHVELERELSASIYVARPARALTGVADVVGNEPFPLDLEAPSKIDFAWFEPRRRTDSARRSRARRASSGDEDDEEAASLAAPLGVRLLLQEWSLGRDPEQYAWRNVYSEPQRAEAEASKARMTAAAAEQEQRASTRRRRALGASASQPFFSTTALGTSASQPPTLSSSRAPQHRKTRKPPREVNAPPGFSFHAAAAAASTQPSQSQAPTPTQTQTQTQTPASSSQQAPAFVATQVMPGKFGGRPQAKDKSGGGKKTKKPKRVAGF